VTGVTVQERRALWSAMHDQHCHGIVTRDFEQDACGKPVAAIIDGRGTEAETYWPACTYHAHRYGGGHVVPLMEILLAEHAFVQHLRNATVGRP